MAINLFEKYQKNIETRFTQKSITQGNSTEKYSWDGSKSIILTEMQSVGLNDYTRSGANRYGTPEEVQDMQQVLSIRLDKSYTGTIDKGNNTQQGMIKNAAKFIKMQNDEVVVPFQDAYNLKEWATNAGAIVKASAEITADNIKATFIAMRKHYVDKKVPVAKTCVYVSSDVYAVLLDCKFFESLEKLGVKAITEGEVGKAMSFRIIEAPEGYLPEGVAMLATHKDAVVAPVQLKTCKVHEDAPGIRGALVEASFISDAFVIGAKADGVYTLLESTATNVVANPTITAGTGAIACATDGAAIYYTTDGSDPRYSKTAKVYTAAVGATNGTVRACAKLDGYFPSAVVLG